MPPEEAFHRFFLRPERTQEEKQRYCGRDELWGVPDDERAILTLIRDDINSKWAAQRTSLLRQDEHPLLHFDYIDTRHPPVGTNPDGRFATAIAFENEGVSCVGVTRDQMDEISWLSWRLAHTQRILDGFHIQPDQQDSANHLGASLFSAQCLFLTSHELGHHVHGHILADHSGGAYSEFEPSDQLTPEESLIAQRKEIDADGYAVTMCLDNFHLLEGPRAEFHRGLGKSSQHPRSDRWLLRLTCLAAGAFFFSRRGERKLRRHPPPLVRMHFVMNQIHAWAGRNSKPNLAKWATVSRFQRLMAAVEGAIGMEHQEIDWHDQSTFLLSPGGKEYREILEEAEAPVRDLYAPRRWKVLPRAGSRGGSEIVR